MLTPPLADFPIQADEALHVLVDLYTRRVQSAIPSQSHPRNEAYWHACERIRETLLLAACQQDALERLAMLETQIEAPHTTDEATTAWRATVGQARELLAQVIQAGGNVQVLFVGESDGFRHLCLRCSQDERNFAHIRFF